MQPRAWDHRRRSYNAAKRLNRICEKFNVLGVWKRISGDAFLSVRHILLLVQQDGLASTAHTLASSVTRASPLRFRETSVRKSFDDASYQPGVLGASVAELDPQISSSLFCCGSVGTPVILDFYHAIQYTPSAYLPWVLGSTRKHAQARLLRLFL